MKDRLVVLGGTFNPLSKAHVFALDLACKKVHASKKILLPTAYRYLDSYKCLASDEILDSFLRDEILDELNRRDNSYIIERCEEEGTTYKAYDSLNYIKKKYDTSDIYFVCGSEKLKEFDTWYRYDDLLNEFKFIVIKRGEDDIAKEIDNSEVVKNHLNAFTFVDSEESYLDISSTKIREYIKENDIAKIKELTFDFVVEILVEKGLVHYEK